MGTDSSRDRQRSLRLAVAPEPSSVLPSEAGTNNRMADDTAHVARLETFRRAIAAGTYHVDSRTLADRLLDSLVFFESDIV